MLTPSSEKEKRASFLKSISHAGKKNKIQIIIFFICSQSKLKWKEIFLHYTNMAQNAGDKCFSDG